MYAARPVVEDGRGGRRQRRRDAMEPLTQVRRYDALRIAGGIEQGIAQIARQHFKRMTGRIAEARRSSKTDPLRPRG